MSLLSWINEALVEQRVVSFVGAMTYTQVEVLNSSPCHIRYYRFEWDCYYRRGDCIQEKAIILGGSNTNWP